MQEALHLGFIQPSTSPAAPGFFSVEQKDESFRLCIDYCGLKAIPIKLLYPLHLVSAAIEQVFSKLGLYSAILMLTQYGSSLVFKRKRRLQRLLDLVFFRL